MICKCSCKLKRVTLNNSVAGVYFGPPIAANSGMYNFTAQSMNKFDYENEVFCFIVRKWTAKTLIWLEAGAFEILWDLTLEWFLSDNKLCALGNYIMSSTFGFVYNCNEVLKGRLTKHFLVRPWSFVLFRKLFYHLSVFSLDWKKKKEFMVPP